MIGDGRAITRYACSALLYVSGDVYLFRVTLGLDCQARRAGNNILDTLEHSVRR
jgi:hypothetical protein